MLLSVDKCVDYDVKSVDGDLGGVRDLLFDDRQWTVRYIVVRPGNWLTGKQVLISPVSIQSVEPERKEIHVKLTKAEVEAGPALSEHEPVSRQMESDLADFYHWPHYWLTPMTPLAGGAAVPPDMEQTSPPGKSDGDPALRSFASVKGYGVLAGGSKVGKVDDFLFDAENWDIAALVVDTAKSLSDQKKLVLRRSISEISWEKRSVNLAMTSQSVERAPGYDPADDESGLLGKVRGWMDGKSDKFL